MRRSLKLIFFFCLLITLAFSTTAQNSITWSNDTTITGDKTSLSLTYPVDSAWEIVFQNDKSGSITIDQTNYSEPPHLSFSLVNTFDSTSNERHFEGMMSNDSSSISGTLFINDSLSFPITLYKGKKNAEENVTSTYSTYLFWWLIPWIIFSLLMLLYFKARKKDSASSTNDLVMIAGSEWLLKILPVVRISCKKIFPGKRKVLIVYNDSIFIFYKNKKTNIDMLHEEESKNLIPATHSIKNNKQFPISSITKVEVEKESRLGKVRFWIYFDKARKENFALPGYEMPNLLKALQSLGTNNLKTNLPIKFHSPGIWIRLFLFSFGAVYLYQNILHPGNMFAIIIFYILFIIVLFYILFLLFSSATWFMDHLPRNLNNPKIKKQNVDLSHRKPFRSVPISIFLKVVGAVIFVLTFLFLKKNYLPASVTNFILPFNYFRGFLIVCGYLLSGLILNLSLAFANRNPKASRPNDKRPPILYLRSFLDDRETTFQPGTWLSSFMGVDPPYYHLSKYIFITNSFFYRLNKKIYKYFYNNHPVRMLRLIFGWPADTSEQQLELFFKKKGPFVAIGKPGERIVTSGASRMYVTNEEWQSVIIDYLNASQLVVLQPSSTEGIWWEINQSLHLVNPMHLFLCMINYKAHQNAYEDFRIRFENIKEEIKLPRFIGNANEICFFSFDNEWKPKLQRLKYKNFIYWPFAANAADLKKSLTI